MDSRHLDSMPRRSWRWLVGGVSILVVRQFASFTTSNEDYWGMLLQATKAWTELPPAQPDDSETPLQVLQDYIRRHGVVNGTNTPSFNNNDSLFAVGHYRCPHQAGNQLHSFLNQLLWAILTDRTFLWHYSDYDWCMRGHQVLGKVACEHPSALADCDRVLTRASWIPAYDDVLPNDASMLLYDMDANWWKTHDPFRPQDPDIRVHRLPDSSSDESSNNNNPHTTTTIHRIVRYPTMILPLKGFAFAAPHDPLLRTPRAKQLETILYSRGASYLYGMLLEHVFAIRDQPPPTVDPDAFSIALHSRHRWHSDTGADLRREIRCLHQLLTHRAKHQACQVVVLSDRVATLQGLQSYLPQQLNCSMLVASHETNSTSSFSHEHGPFAGAGFFTDLALASQVKDGVVTTGQRSSSMLLAERLVYLHNTKHVCDMPEPPKPEGEAQWAVRVQRSSS